MSIQWNRLLYFIMEGMTPDTIDFNSLSKKQLVELVIAKYNDCSRLEEENKELQIQVENLEPNYENWYNLINWEREDREELTKRLTIDVLILIIALVIQSLLILLK